MMAAVYAMLALPVACSVLLRRSWAGMSNGAVDSLKAGAGLLACTLGSAWAFFLVDELCDLAAIGLVRNLVRWIDDVLCPRDSVFSLYANR